jgi:ElaB/YqjD/DUF883 family membrane-anchored ribosome-binding protein
MAVEKLTFEMNAVGNAVPEMKKVQTQLGQVSKQMQTATASMRTNASAGRMLARSQGNLTRNLGMASLQFQDIAVQASMGTDALRIMTMQGPQLASVFGPKGMIIGALVALGGALAMASKGSTSLSFDFKKLGSDIKPAFEPLISVAVPALEVAKDVFHAFRKAVMITINNIIRSFLIFIRVIQAVPGFIKEAFTRPLDAVKLLNANIQIAIIAIKQRFLELFLGLTEGFVNFAQTTAKELNRLFKTSFPEDIGQETFNDLENKIQSAQQALGELYLERLTLSKEMEKPFKSFTDLKDDLKEIVQFDLFSLFTFKAKQSAEEIKKLQDRMQSFADSVKSSFETGFMDIVKGTKSVKDAFRQMAIDIIAQLYRVLVVQRIVGSFDAAAGTGTGIVGGIMKLAGNIFRANGGSVSGNKPYIVGERGPEMFIPNRSGTVIPNKNMGGGGVVVQQTINVTTGVQQTVRNEIQTLLPQIAEASKAAVLDARRRGGSFANAF